MLKRLIPAGAAALSLTTALHAADIDLGKLEVTEEKISQNKTVEVIDADAIKDSNFKDVSQALSYTSGVTYAPGGIKGNSRFTIRGYSYNQVGVFIDGIPMYFIYDKGSDWSQYMIFDAKEINISKGFTSVLYGPDTLGGAINIVTKKPQKELEFALKAQYQTPNQHYEYVSLGTNLGSFYAQASFSNMQRDYFLLSNSFKTTPFQPSRKRLSSFYDNKTLKIKLGYTPNATDEYSLSYSFSRGKRGGQRNNTQTQNTNWYWPHYDTNRLYFLSSTKIADFATLTSRAFYDTYYDDMFMVSNNPPEHSYYDEWTAGAGLGLNFDFTQNDLLKLSLLFKNNNHKKKGFPSNTLKEYFTTQDLNELVSYFAAEYTRIFTPRLRSTFSLSYTRDDVLSARLFDLTTKSLKKEGAANLYGVGAQAIVYYDVLDNFDVYANVGKKDNVPTLNQRYGSMWGTRVPNPNLSTETALNTELGANFYPLDSLHLSLAGYYINYTSMITTISSTDITGCSAPDAGRCSKTINAANGYSWGIEAAANYEILDTLSVIANYTYMEKTAKQANTKITDFPNHIANLRVKYNPIDSVDLIAGARFTSWRWATKTVSNQTTYIKSPNVFLLDLRAAWRPIKGLEVALGVDNATDQNYWYSYGYELEGIRGYLEVGYRY